MEAITSVPCDVLIGYRDEIEADDPSFNAALLISVLEHALDHAISHQADCPYQTAASLTRVKQKLSTLPVE